MVEKKTYIAFDGKEFNDREECIVYETQIKSYELGEIKDDKKTSIELPNGHSISGEDIILYFDIKHNVEKCAYCPFSYECGYMMGKQTIKGVTNPFAICEAISCKIK